MLENDTSDLFEDNTRTNLVKKPYQGPREELNQVQRRKLFGGFFSKNRNLGKVYPIQHVIEIGMTGSPVFRLLQRWEKGIQMKKGTNLAGNHSKVTPKRGLPW